MSFQEPDRVRLRWSDGFRFAFEFDAGRDTFEEDLLDAALSARVKQPVKRWHDGASGANYEWRTELELHVQAGKRFYTPGEIRVTKVPGVGFGDEGIPYFVPLRLYLSTASRQLTPARHPEKRFPTGQGYFDDEVIRINARRWWKFIMNSMEWGEALGNLASEINPWAEDE